MHRWLGFLLICSACGPTRGTFRHDWAELVCLQNKECAVDEVWDEVMFTECVAAVKAQVTIDSFACHFSRGSAQTCLAQSRELACSDSLPIDCAEVWHSVCPADLPTDDPHWWALTPQNPDTGNGDTGNGDTGNGDTGQRSG